MKTPPAMTNWTDLQRLADKVGSVTNPVTLMLGKTPPFSVSDNGGAQARAMHSDDEECVVTSDGTRHFLTGESLSL